MTAFTASLLPPTRRFTCHGSGVIVVSDPIPLADELEKRPHAGTGKRQ